MALNNLQREIVKRFYDGESCHSIAASLNTYLAYVENAIREHYIWQRGNIASEPIENW